jgi:hypothetical protein
MKKEKLKDIYIKIFNIATRAFSLDMFNDFIYQNQIFI